MATVTRMRCGARPRRAGKLARRSIRRRRRWLAVLVMVLPLLWIVGGDISRRGRLLWETPWYLNKAYLGTAVASAVFWGLLLYVATAARRRARLSARGGVRRAISGIVAAIYVVLFPLIVGTQAAFHSVWNCYLDIDGQLYEDSPISSLWAELPLDRPAVIGHYLLALGFAIATVALGRRWSRPGVWAQRLVPLLLVPLFVGTVYLPASYRTYQASTPDTLYIHAYVGLAKELLGVTNETPYRRVGRREPELVPATQAQPKRPRNVIFILQETQRADVSCVQPDPNCDKATPWSNVVAADRVGYPQMRAHATTTAISIAVLWTGLPPTVPANIMMSAPMLWEYAHAAGIDTGYWTSQHVMFMNMRLFVQDIPARKFAAATHLDPMANLDAGALDEKLTARVKEDWADLQEPFFGVVHYSNPHYPYIYQEAFAPFQPSEHNRDAAANAAYLNYYRNVVYRSDLAVAELVHFIRSTEKGKRTVIIFTADHGEGFREHWQMGHTSSLYDEELRVPTWIDAPEGTLDETERASIESASADYLWHFDLTPTMLDLLGLWDNSDLQPFLARMPGHPMTRPERTVGPVILSNCASTWECSFRNWGLMQGPLKLEARQWDDRFHCFDVARDPMEKRDLGEARCAPLADLARSMFGAMPNEVPHDHNPADWEK